MNETNTTKNYKSGIIFLLAIACFFILLKSLPFAPKENAGLALLAFVAILWLTEALHVTVTALLVPLIAIALCGSNHFLILWWICFSDSVTYTKTR